MDLDQTQAIAVDDSDDDNTDDMNSEDGDKPVGFLKVLHQKGLSETIHQLYEGDNIIGRNEGTCHVCIPSKSLSKEHACIQIKGENHLIFDKGSRNKSKRGKMFLSPQVRYELKHEDTLTFADVKCLYLQKNFQFVETVSDSGSETDESLLLQDKDGHVDQNKSKSQTVGGTVSNKQIEGNGSKSKETSAPLATLVLSESESDEEPLLVSKDTPRAHQTVLCADSDPDVSVDPEMFGAATQAYATSSYRISANGEDEDSSHCDLLGAATQCYTDVGEEEEDVVAIDEPTQAFHKTDLPSTSIEKLSSQPGGTQSFDVVPKTSKGGTQTFEEAENKKDDSFDSANRPTQVFEEDDGEEDNYVKNLFAVSTLACDDFSDCELVEEDEAAGKECGKDDATQAFPAGEDNPTLIIPGKNNDDNSDTVQMEGDTATVSVIESVTTKRNSQKSVAKDKSIKLDPELPTQVLDNTGPVASAGKEQRRSMSSLPTQVLDETLCIATSASPAENAGDTVALEETAPEPESARRSRRKKGHSGTVVHDVTETAVVHEGVCEGTSSQTQVFGANEDTAEEKNEDLKGIDNNNIKKSIARGKRSRVRQVSDSSEEDDAVQPWKIQPDQEEATQAYGVADNDNESSQLCDEDDDEDDDIVPSGNEPTQAYGLVDEEQTQVVDDYDEFSCVQRAQDDIETQKVDVPLDLDEDKDSSQPCHSDDPTQKFDKIFESAGRSGQENKVTGEELEDDSEEESMLFTGHVTSDDPTQIFGGEPTETGKDKSAGEDLPTLAYDMAGEKSPQKREMEDKKAKNARGKSPQVRKEDEASKNDCGPTVTYTMEVEKMTPVKRGRKSRRNEMVENAEDVEPGPTLAYDMEVEKTEASTTRGRTRGSLNKAASQGVNRKEVAVEISSPERKSPELPFLGEETKEKVAAAAVTLTEEFVPDSVVNSDSEEKPPMIPLPSRSPLKSALAGRKKSLSPTPKQVVFLEPEKEQETGTADSSPKKRRTRGGVGKGKLSSPSKTIRVGDVQESQATEEQENKEDDSSLLSSKRQRNSRGDAGKADKNKIAVTSLDDGNDDNGDVSKQKVASVSNKKKPKLPRKSTAANKTVAEEQTLESESRVDLETEKSSSSENVDIKLVEGNSVDFSDGDMKSGRQDKKKKVGQRGLVQGKDKLLQSLPLDSKKPNQEVDEKKDDGDASDETGSMTSVDCENAQQVDSHVKKAKNVSTSGRLVRDTVKNEESKSSESSGKTPTGGVRISSRGRKISSNTRLNDFETDKSKTVTKKSGPASAQRDEGKTVNTSVEEQAKGRGKKEKTLNQLDNIVDLPSVSAASTKQPDKKVRPNRRKKEEDLDIPAPKKTRGADNSREPTPEGSLEASGTKKHVESGNKIVRTGKKRGQKSQDLSTGKEENDEDTKDAEALVRLSPRLSTEVEAYTEQLVVRGRRGKASTTPNTSTTKRDKQSDPEIQSETHQPVSHSSTSGNEVVPATSQLHSQNMTSNRKTRQVPTCEQSPLARPARGRKTVSAASGSQDSPTSTPSERRRGAKGNTSSQDTQSSASKRKTESQAMTPTKASRLSLSQAAAGARGAAGVTAQSPVLRQSTLGQKPKVMFTGVIDEHGEKTIHDLGGELASNIHSCTHLITDKIRRTVKFLGGLAKGALIVSPRWLESSKQAGTFLDGHKFLVSDPATEKQHKFSLSVAISKAAGKSLLAGYRVHVSKSVRPEPAQMQDILQCAGAEYLKSMPSKFVEKTVVVSCVEDEKLCQVAIKAGIPVVGAEFILTGILRQEVDVDSHCLFSGDVTATDSSQSLTRAKRK